MSDRSVFSGLRLSTLAACLVTGGLLAAAGCTSGGGDKSCGDKKCGEKGCPGGAEKGCAPKGEPAK